MWFNPHFMLGLWSASISQLHTNTITYIHATSRLEHDDATSLIYQGNRHMGKELMSITVIEQVH